MSTTVYYSKINLSSHIFEVYDDPHKLIKINDKLISKIRNKMEYKREDKTLFEGKEVTKYEAKYWIDDIQKLDGKYDYAIAGRLYKKSKIFYNSLDAQGNCPDTIKL